MPASILLAPPASRAPETAAGCDPSARPRPATACAAKKQKAILLPAGTVRTEPKQCRRSPTALCGYRSDSSRPAISAQSFGRFHGWPWSETLRQLRLTRTYISSPDETRNPEIAACCPLPQLPELLRSIHPESSAAEIPVSPRSP